MLSTVSQQREQPSVEDSNRSWSASDDGKPAEEVYPLEFRMAGVRFVFFGRNAGQPKGRTQYGVSPALAPGSVLVALMKSVRDGAGE